MAIKISRATTNLLILHWPKISSHTQQPAKILMFLPAARYHTIYYHHDPTRSQQRSWDCCKLPNLQWSTTIVTKAAASKDPDLLSAANSPLSHDNRKLTSIPTDRAIDQPINSQTRPTNQIEQTNQTDQTGQSTNIQIIQVRPAD